MNLPSLSPIAGLMSDKEMVLLEANVPLATSVSWGLLARGKKLGSPGVDRTSVWWVGYPSDIIGIQARSQRVLILF